MLLDMVKSMMSFPDLPVSLWGYTIEFVAYLLNKIPIKVVVSIPYKIWKGKNLNLKAVKIWDCPDHFRRYNHDKLESRIERYKFLRYPKETCEYYIYHPRIKMSLLLRGYCSLKRNIFLVEIV